MTVARVELTLTPPGHKLVSHTTEGIEMSHTIKGFQEDQALFLADKIKAKINVDIDIDRIVRVFQTHGVVSDHTLWRKLPSVLDAFGIDYDEIEEVAP